MATKRQIEEQDRASANRRTEAIGRIVDRATKDGEAAGNVRGSIIGAFDELAIAIDAEGADVAELKRKGWQSALKSHVTAAEVVRTWLDHLTSYTPPRGKPEPAPIAVDHRAKTPAELDARLQAAFPDIGMPLRHIMTVLEGQHPIDVNTDTAVKGAMCGATTGSWTHPGGANCVTCHGLYAEQTSQPYAGPVAHGNEVPTYGGVPVITDDQISFARPWRDGPVTPEVARAMREADPALPPAVLTHEQVEGVNVITDPNMPADEMLIVSPPDPSVDFPGGAVKITNLPPGAVDLGNGSFAMESGPALVEPTAFTAAADALKLNLIDPTGPRVRQRMSAAQVREHGLARQRGLEHRSVSQVEGFSDCGTRYALSDMETPAWWNVGGKALHRCVETINRYVAMYRSFNDAAPGVRDAEHMWLKAFDAEISDQHAATPDHPMSTWRAAKKGLENYDWWRVEGPPMIERYVAWLRGMLADGWQIARTVDGRPVIELEVYTNVGAAVPNLSIIDLALYHGPRDLVLVVDVKAGNSAPKSTFQLGVYGWALLGVLAGNLRRDRVRGAYYRARTGELVPNAVQGIPSNAGWPILGIHPWADVVQRYRETDMIERQGVYIPNVTTFCGGCGVRDLCPAQATEDQKREGVI